LTDKTVVRDGNHSLDLVAEYTGHPYDQVLDLYYAKARMYDAADRRFMAVDLVKGTDANPQSLVQYAYCLNNPIKFIDPFGLAANNPVDLLSNSANFANVSKITHNGNDYYTIRGVMDVLGGVVKYIKETESVNLSLVYSSITVMVAYSVKDLYANNSITSASGIWMMDSSSYSGFGAISGTLPILYKSSNTTYVNLGDLRKYFEKVWCGSDYKDNQAILSGIEDPNNSTRGREVIIPQIVNGKENGKTLTFNTRDKWGAAGGGTYSGKPSKDSRGRYRVAVGPRILDPGYSNEGKVWSSEFPNRDIDVVLKDKTTGEVRTLECVVTDFKAHSYNTHPDGHENKGKYTKGYDVTVDIGNGLIQTGISYPNSWNSDNEATYIPSGGEICVVEFCTTSSQLDFNPGNYTFEKIIVLN
jgi:RHS repeat-associated protein